MANSINNLMKKLQTELRKVKYIGRFDIDKLMIGKSEAYVPIYYHVLYTYSRHVAKLVANNGLKLVARDDAKFVRDLFQILKTVFNFEPKLTQERFLQSGYVELKVTTCIEVLQLVQLVRQNMGEPADSKTGARPKVSAMPARPSRKTFRMEPKEKVSAQASHSQVVHSTPKVKVEADGAACSSSPQSLSSCSSLSSISDQLEDPTLNGNYKRDDVSRLKAEVKALKVKVDEMSSRLDELTVYIQYSPATPFGIKKPRNNSTPS